MPRREDFEKRHPNTTLQIVQGRFYVGPPGRETLYKRKLASFEELGFDAKGDPPPGESAKAARQRENLLTGRYAEILNELVAEDAERNPADGVPFSRVFQQFLEWVAAHRRDPTGELYGLTGNRV